MSDPGSIRIKDYDYPLPPDKIAQFPLANRDASKLLVYRQGQITDGIFSEIADLLPSNSLLVFNNTRVVRARLIFMKPTGGHIEVFCLEPVSPTSEVQAAFRQQSGSTWKCLVGNLKRWKSGPLMIEVPFEGIVCQLVAERLQDCNDGSFEIAFRWTPPEKTFSEILETIGLIPLPPYITRPAVSADDDRYQTIYSTLEGSVAAPTAGLHFTAPLLNRIALKGIDTAFVTLHVGVGTFRPVTTDRIGDHIMHHEKIVVQRRTVEKLLQQLNQPVFAIGTTSARTLESLYWIGVKLIRHGTTEHLRVSQWDPYQKNYAAGITVRQSLETLLRYLEVHHLAVFSGETQLMIVPGYRYKILSGLITNFHMPQSTLLLLVSAMVGDDWQHAYNHALQHGYRFLSYGDSCLFFNPQT